MNESPTFTRLTQVNQDLITAIRSNSRRAGIVVWAYNHVPPGSALARAILGIGNWALSGTRNQITRLRSERNTLVDYNNAH